MSECGDALRQSNYVVDNSLLWVLPTGRVSQPVIRGLGDMPVKVSVGRRREEGREARNRATFVGLIGQLVIKVRPVRQTASIRTDYQMRRGSPNSCPTVRQLQPTPTHIHAHRHTRCQRSIHKEALELWLYVQTFPMNFDSIAELFTWVACQVVE